MNVKLLKKTLFKVDSYIVIFRIIHVLFRHALSIIRIMEAEN